MREITKIDHSFGEQGSAKLALGVEASDLVLTGSASYKIPLAKVVDPVMNVVDGLIDKLEQLIPGDQSAMAAEAKADARAALVKVLSESAAAPVAE